MMLLAKKLKKNAFADGNLGGYTKYEYDADGNLIKEEQYDANCELKWYTKREYDALGRFIKKQVYKTVRVI